TNNSVEYLVEDANRQLEGTNRLVIALPRALVDQGEIGGACVLPTEKEPAQTAGTGTLLFRGQKLVPLRYQESLIYASDHPSVTGCRIFVQFDGDLCAASYFD